MILNTGLLASYLLSGSIVCLCSFDNLHFPVCSKGRSCKGMYVTFSLQWFYRAHVPRDTEVPPLWCSSLAWMESGRGPGCREEADHSGQHSCRLRSCCGSHPVASVIFLNGMHFPPAPFLPCASLISWKQLVGSECCPQIVSYFASGLSC